MSDSTNKAADNPCQGLPARVRAIITPWWERKARSIAEALEGAREGEVVEFEGRRHTVEELVAAAERAVEMADRLSETSE